MQQMFKMDTRGKFHVYNPSKITSGYPIISLPLPLVIIALPYC
jgi:hypothetical protein